MTIETSVKDKPNDLFDQAIDNISRYGDTDIFPFPIENSLFYDIKKDVKRLLQKIDKEFQKYIEDYPVEKHSSCIPVGIGGYRWATQIDPIWNAYFLYLVLSIHEDIETSRISIAKDVVHSYRVNIDSDYPKFFDPKYNWRTFMDKTMEFAELEEFKFVVKFDIGDFYNRVYHHRLENILNRITSNTIAVKRIMTILKSLSLNASYGLPIGGNASRILAELLLTSTDNFIINKRIAFCRFVDDFVMFAPSKEEAFSYLNSVADYLLKNEGLSIQKTKTQILSCSEYIGQVKNILQGDDEPESIERSSFMRLHIHFDPYSMNADEQYEDLKENLSKFNVLKLLKDELRKSKIQQAMGKQLLNAISHLEGEKLGLAFQAISVNIEAFYPIIPSVFIMVQKCLKNAPIEFQNQFVRSICSLIDSNSYLLQSENNAAFAARVLSLSDLDEATQAIVLLHSSRSSSLVRTNCIYAMINKKIYYWLSDQKTSFATLGRPERRAFIAASYFLGDEGKHWRSSVKRQLTDLELLAIDWVSEKQPLTTNWKLPL
ncbi:MAG: RNA-directed DNA polymerase [Pseudomonadota bacterium]